MYFPRKRNKKKKKINDSPKYINIQTWKPFLNWMHHVWHSHEELLQNGGQMEAKSVMSDNFLKILNKSLHEFTYFKLH